MERYLAEQTVIFAWAIVMGLLIGLLYDMAVCAGRVARVGRVGRGLLDLLLCALGLLLFLLFLLTLGRGEVRSYILLGCALGLAAWHLILSRPVRAVLLPLFRTMRRAAGCCRRGVLKAFSYPRGN